jgi:hypothetical protein
MLQSCSLVFMNMFPRHIGLVSFWTQGILRNLPWLVLKSLLTSKCTFKKMKSFPSNQLPCVKWHYTIQNWAHCPLHEAAGSISLMHGLGYIRGQAFCLVFTVLKTSNGHIKEIWVFWRWCGWKVEFLDVKK